MVQSIGKLLETSIAHYEKKEYQAAERAIDELLKAHPDFHRGQFLKAVILEETGRGADAERHYAASGNRYALWFRLAAQLENVDPGRAILYYERVAGNDVQNNLLWFNLGSLYEKTGRPDDARACFRKLSPLREALSRIFIPVGFLILLVTGGFLMIRRGDYGLSSVVFMSAIFCLFWLRRDGGKAVQMIMKKKKFI